MNTLTKKRQQLKKVAAAVKLFYIGYTTKFDIKPIFKGERQMPFALCLRFLRSSEELFGNFRFASAKRIDNIFNGYAADCRIHFSVFAAA